MCTQGEPDSGRILQRCGTVDGRNGDIKIANTSPHIAKHGLGPYAAGNVIGKSAQIGASADEYHALNRRHTLSALVATHIPIAIVPLDLIRKCRGDSRDSI